MKNKNIESETLMSLLMLHDWLLPVSLVEKETEELAEKDKAHVKLDAKNDKNKD